MEEKLHWKTATNNQKIGYLLSKVGLEPDAMSHSFGRRAEYHFRISEEHIYSMHVKDVCEELQMRLIVAREGLLKDIDEQLAKIAGVQALENHIGIF